MTEQMSHEPAPVGIDERSHRFVFIGGLHRSGTSLLFQLLRDHPDVSAFRDTGAKEDEGQHLQSVYEPARALGGEGRFGFHPNAHMVEVDPDQARADSRRLLADWAPLWDLSRPVLVEKSPPNLIRARYLQSLFPGSRFVMLLRHPIEVVLAEHRRARRTSLGRLFEHWFRCYEQFLADVPHIEHVLALRYEDVLARPQGTLDEVLDFIGLAPAPEANAAAVRSDASRRYRAQWDDLRASRLRGPGMTPLIRRYESRANHFGYSLAEPDRRSPWALDR
jgi:hypothetical protein